MKNQYIGDIGDYGKYGLSRFLAGRGIQIGVNWYLTENDKTADGKFTDYLKDDSSPERLCDPELFDALRRIVLSHSIAEKSVDMISDAKLIPNAVYYNSKIPDTIQNSKANERNRLLWFNDSLLLLDGADLIFADPDNGLSFRKTASHKGSEKHVLPEEIVNYYREGKDVVYYCHKGRRKPEAWEQAKTEIRKCIRDAQILGLTFHRGTQRSYIFVVHPDQYRKYILLLNDFVKTAWNNMFTREPISGNVLTTSEELMLQG